MAPVGLISVGVDGILAYDGKRVRCALGRSGLVRDKREGDGGTPVGTYLLRRLYYRADRLARPLCGLPCRPLRRTDGWCDDPEDRLYNQPLQRPHPARHEALWRDDGLYDVIVPIGYNDDPVGPGRGSAIFLHVAAPGLTPTEGCVALPLPDLLSLLRRCGPQSRIALGAA